MGSGKSTSRKVSYGVDDEDRVRILRGVKLSEDVLQRMRGAANINPGPRTDTGASFSGSPRLQPQDSPQGPAQPNIHSNTRKPASDTTEEQRSRERQQSVLREEMAKVAQSDAEARREELCQVTSRERQHTQQEAAKAEQLAEQLQQKDSQLKVLDAFYKEQLAQLTERNLERYEQSKEQFHTAASKTEVNVRSCSTGPVCAGLQAQVFSCYQGNTNQTLRCADLSKEYMQCINAAKKKLLVNNG